jgi:hypothetical protein
MDTKGLRGVVIIMLNIVVESVVDAFTRLLTEIYAHD